MSAISQKSISGITSITSPAGTDDQISLHTSNTNEALKIDGAGNLHFNNHVNTTGVSTASNFKTGSSNLHSTGLNVGNTFVHSTGINGSSADIDDFISVGSNIHLGNAGVITATSYRGDGSQLTGVTGSGSGVVIKHDDSTVGTAGTINFSTNLDVTAVSAGIVTVTASGSGGGTSGVVDSGSWTASAGSPHTINTYGYDSAELMFEYTAFIKNGSDYQTQKLLVMRDGTTVTSTQYAIMYSNELLVQLDATISGSDLLVKATPETGVTGSTTYRLNREAI